MDEIKYMRTNIQTIFCFEIKLIKYVVLTLSTFGTNIEENNGMLSLGYKYSGTIIDQ